MGALDTPRIPPVRRDDADDSQVELFDQLGPGEPIHLFGTLAHHPKLLRSWLPFGGRLLLGGLIDQRLRELAILRTAARCGSDYEWGQHVPIARNAGVTDDEILACAAPNPTDLVEPVAAAVIGGADDLIDNHELSDATWGALAEHLDDAGMIEFTMLVGHYAMLAGMLRSVRVATDGPLAPVGSLTPPDAAP